MRFIHLVRPLLCVVPEVAQPDHKISITEKIFWTAFALMMYLFACGIPLYGMQTAHTSDPFHWLRVILASNRGTLMELGLAPIMTSSLVLQLLQGSNVISVNMAIKEERALFSGAQKLVGIFVTIAEATAYVFAGMYGDISVLGIGNCALLITQLIFAGILVILLDEMLQKGYGLGSGISLFMAVNTCTDIVWNSIAPVSIATANGTEFQGCLIAFFHLLITRSDKARALQQAFYRTHLPNITNLLATVFIFMVVIYFQGWRVNLPVKYQKHRTQTGQYPIKLFYTSNMPVVLYAAFVSQLYFASQLLYTRFGSSVFVKLLGVWVEGGTGQTQPVSGLAYYLSPPPTLSALVMDPLHALFYLSFVLSTCAMFSKAWMEVTGIAPRDVAQQLRDQQMIMKGHRDSALVNILNRYIPTAAVFGGMCVGGLTVAADFLGALGTGTGILLAVTIIFQYYEIFMREQSELLGALGMVQ
mmetsp:Transcript_22435/g.29100  ORF Transcript_22435/g.29100 Transcript_22435/m.29100 type:complete len:473 (-) Transcript_22435:437-1855(-)